MEESLHDKTSSIRLVVSIEYRLVTDGRTDGQTDGWTDRHTTTASTALAQRRTLKTRRSWFVKSLNTSPLRTDRDNVPVETRNSAEKRCLPHFMSTESHRWAENVLYWPLCASHSATITRRRSGGNTTTMKIRNRLNDVHST